MISRRNSTNSVQFVYMGDSTRVKNDFLGTTRLQLTIGYSFGMTCYLDEFDICTYSG